MYDQLAPYKILVVDDFSQFRLTIISMLKRLGASDIDQAANGVDAVSMCSQKSYDIILCDYNLGEGQDGQQVLEELIERSIIRRGIVFIMVTAEMTSAQVMGAIEYSPDSYLAKPFNFDQLAKRLNRILEKNTRLKKIYQNMNTGELDVALHECDEIIKSTPSLRFSCLQLKSIILEQSQKFEDAKAVCEEVVEEQPILWALIGIGKYYFAKQKYQDALDQFKKAENHFPRQVSVLDWQAKCYQALDDIPEAEKAILQAVEISPKSLSRQANLGEISESLGHYDIAYKAYTRTVNEGKYSCLIEPEHYHHLFDNARDLIAGVSSRDRRYIVKSTETVSKLMEDKFKDDPAALAENMASLACFFSTVGKKDQVERCLKKLVKSFDNSECEISESTYDYIQNNMQLLKESNIEVEELSQIDGQLEISKQAIETEKRGKIIADELTQEGLILIKQSRKDEALEKFREVLTHNARDSTYLFNPAQLILLDNEMKQDPGLRKEAKKYLGAISLKPDDKRKSLYSLLKSKVEND